MLTALTLARKGEVWTLIEGPNADITGQKERFKTESRNPQSAFDEIQVWNSRGCIKRQVIARAVAADQRAAGLAGEPPPAEVVSPVSKKKGKTS